MKALLCVLLFTSYCGKTAKAETPGEIGAETKQSVKQATRKVGDKACETINGKLECDQKKIKHQQEARIDKAETEKRQAAAVARKERRGRENAKLNLKEQACREINGKLECAGKKAKEKIENAVE